MVFSFRNWVGVLFTSLALAACGGGQRGDLDEDSQLALEIGIISMFASPNAMFPVALSDDLRKRHEGLEGIQLRNSAYGSNMPTDGGRIIKGAPGGRVLETEVAGTINAFIKVQAGEVGLIDGNIYIGEGTTLTNKEGEEFTFVSGRWSDKPQKPLRGGADTVAIVTITFAQDKTKAVGLSDSESSNSFIAAMTLFETFKDGTHPDKDRALLDLVEQIATTPIKTASNGSVVFLGDIARVEYRYAAKSTSQDEDVLMVSTSPR